MALLDYVLTENGLKSYKIKLDELLFREKKYCCGLAVHLPCVNK